MPGDTLPLLGGSILLSDRAPGLDSYPELDGEADGSGRLFWLDRAHTFVGATRAGG